MLRLYIQAPFAVFRTFTAGWYRPTATFLTPSAAYGLALNLAGIETRRDDGLSAMTLTQFGLPPARIALGAVADDSRGAFPTVQSIFQQLHNYPVGASGKERKEDAKGSKYNITPVRREFLADLRAIVVFDFFEKNAWVEDRMRQALNGKSPKSATRYGLPFLGDNAFLIDKLEVRDKPVHAHWFCTVGKDDGPSSHSTRLTIWVDRQDMSRTESALFAPIESAIAEPPESAWTLIKPPPNPSPPTKRPGTKG